MQQNPLPQDECSVTRHEGYCAGRFRAMASPCEVLVAGDDVTLAEKVTRIVRDEALRIERKFSRYRDDNVIAAINKANGEPVGIDDECNRLLDYADACFRLSDGAFDITSGVLRRAWKFDGSDRLPSAAAVAALLPQVGWQKVRREATRIALPAGMEIDLGGIAKEYAVDHALALAGAACDVPLLVNFGGDLAVRGGLPRAGGPGGHATPAADAAMAERTWTIGVESPDGGVAKTLQIRRGAMATSGDARRFLLKDGIRYGHILDPRTGWPVAGAPRSVTVIAATCIEAGTLATLAILLGRGAEEFLAAQDIQHWILW